MSLHEIQELAERERRAKELHVKALGARNNAIKKAIRDGVTMYRIAKETGMTETAIRKIRDK